jgi:nucleoid DNA-binding protein
MINKAKLAHGLKKTSSVSYREAALCVDYFLDTLIDGIARGERVELRGLGSFEVKQVPVRKHHSIWSEKSILPSHGRVVFRPSRKLRDCVWDTAKKG